MSDVEISFDITLSDDSTSTSDESNIENDYDKLIQNLFEHNIKNHNTFKSINDMATIFNERPEATFNIPNTKYLLNKAAKYRYHKMFYIICKKCGDFVIRDQFCERCNVKTNVTKTNYFIHIPIKQQIEKNLKEYFDLIQDYTHKHLARIQKTQK